MDRKSPTRAGRVVTFPATNMSRPEKRDRAEATTRLQAGKTAGQRAGLESPAPGAQVVDFIGYSGMKKIADFGRLRYAKFLEIPALLSDRWRDELTAEQRCRYHEVFSSGR
jgi:hypothetical protein